MQKNGVNHVRTAPYSPRSNGSAERAVQTVKKALSKLSWEGKDTVETKLDRFLFSYRSTPRSTTGTSPAELLMKRKLRSRLSLLKEAKGTTGGVGLTQSESRQLVAGDLVLVRAFQPKRWISGVILAKEGEVLYKVRIPSGVVRKHINQIRSAPNLKSAVLANEDTLHDEPEVRPVIDGEQMQGANGGAIEEEQRTSHEQEDVPPGPVRSGPDPAAALPSRLFARSRRGQTTRFDDYMQ